MPTTYVCIVLFLNGFTKAIYYICYIYFWFYLYFANMIIQIKITVKWGT